jgi:glycosyltransferase involved in cell wall biosynthesis
LRKSDLKILLIGPALNKKKNNIGGATLSFTHTVDYFKEQNYSVEQINTQKFSGSLSSVLNLFFVVISCFFFFTKRTVVFANLSQGGIKYLAPLLVTLARLFRINIIIRAFGGAMDLHYEASNSLWQAIYRYTLKKSLIFYLETKALKNYFDGHSSNIKQLVNPRKPVTKQPAKEPKSFKGRFVFIGQIRKDKGINEILYAIKNVDPSVIIHIYGPIIEDDLVFIEKEIPNYKGILAIDQVVNTLHNYDVLLLPTYYQGEGYPGIIVEAFSIGMPVISTNWRAIPELVKNNINGVLIDPKSPDALIRAINQFGKLDYSVMSQRALESFNQNFQTNNVMGSVENDIKRVSKG